MVSIKRLFYEPIDAPAPFVLTIGEHCKRIPQLTGGHHISPIHLPRQRIIHQLHADPIEVLDDQKILNTTELLQQLIVAEALHSIAASSRHLPTVVALGQVATSQGERDHVGPGRTL